MDLELAFVEQPAVPLQDRDAALTWASSIEVSSHTPRTATPCSAAARITGARDLRDT